MHDTSFIDMDYRYLAMEDYPPEMKHFVEHEGIEVLHYRMEGNKEPFVEINSDDINHALTRLLDDRSHPGKKIVHVFIIRTSSSQRTLFTVLIHCLKGKVSIHDGMMTMQMIHCLKLISIASGVLLVVYARSKDGQ